MATLLRCDQCGKTEAIRTPDRNRPRWSWYRLHCWQRGDHGEDRDFCSSACLDAYTSYTNDDSPTARALRLIGEYGWTQGAHHKQWVIDQVLRLLAGAEYERIAADDWDRGIAP